MEQNKKQSSNHLLLKTIFIIALVLINFGNACQPKYTETIPIRVIDYNYRPIYNAEVSIYYQVSSSITEHGKPIYTYTPVYKTNESGRVDIIVRNQEYNPDKVDCNVKVKVKLFNYEKEETINIDEMPAMNLIRIPAHIFTVKLVDQNLDPLEGRVIIDENYSFNVSGSRTFQICEGVHDLLIIHKHKKRSYELEITKDTTFTSLFEYVPITIEVSNERDVPLPFEVELYDKNYSSDGKIEVKIPSGITTAKLWVLGEEKELPIDTDKKQYYTLFVDRSPPKVYGLDIKQENNETIITLTLEDEGTHASGIKKVYGKLLYEDDTLVEKEFINKDEGVYELKVEKPGSFSFQINAYDKENNLLTLKGKHEVTYEEKKWDVEESQDLLPLIVGVLVVGLIGGGIYVKKKLSEMEEI